MQYRRVLTIAGSDSGGGAGIQADIKTISAHGCYAASAITAITVQNTLGVSAVHPVPAEVVEQQIYAVLSDIGADAIKIGMLHSAAVVQCVCRQLDQFAIPDVVLDPVMVSTSGRRLLDPEAIALLRHELMPRARVITPNIPEAEVLLDGAPIDSPDQMAEAAHTLAEQLHTSVLLKGGHLTDSQLVDVLYDAEQGKVHQLPSLRISTRNTHGTGCTLSSALASQLALGKSLPDAVAAAKQYIDAAILAAVPYQIGQGTGPVHHFYNQTYPK